MSQLFENNLRQTFELAGQDFCRYLQPCDCFFILKNGPYSIDLPVVYKKIRIHACSSGNTKGPDKKTIVALISLNKCSIDCVKQ